MQDTAGKMLDILREDTWTQGAPERVHYNPDGTTTTRLCLIGAYVRIMGLGTTEGDHAYLRRLAGIITEQYPECAAPYQYPSDIVVAFNDVPGRTFAEVRAVLEKTATRESQDDT